MTAWQQLGLLAILAWAAMSIAWVWQRVHQNIGIVDVVWSVCLGFGAILMATTGAGAVAPRVLLAALGGVWSLRLALHLWRRVRVGEDGRYQALRDRWQGHQGKIYGLFVFQAGLVVLFAVPFTVVAMNPVAHASPFWIVGVAIWIVSVAGEALADRQLARFRDEPRYRGRTCRSGLWRYSRHPNYFFEWCHWFTYVALAVGSPTQAISWLGPLTMYIFLRWISGVPYTEMQALRTRGDDYRQYQRSTSMFFPWFPHSSDSARGG
jgi:steroid 5-alpha reductase family enzyme